MLDNLGIESTASFQEMSEVSLLSFCIEKRYIDVNFEWSTVSMFTPDQCVAAINLALLQLFTSLVRF